MTSPKILVLDIETCELEVGVWAIYDQFVSPADIKQDWAIISWAAKWLGQKEVFQEDQRSAPHKRDDKKLLKNIWKLMDEADAILTQNGKSFDAKKLNARFIINGYKPPSPYKHIDTKLLAKKSFGFTSNSLDYLTQKLCVKYKKLKHKEFPGKELWYECMRGNLTAWNEMAKYNIHDVLALEEVYERLAPWGVGINLNVFSDPDKQPCTCGSFELIKNGFAYVGLGKYQRYHCKECGSWCRGAENLILPRKVKRPL